MDPTLFTPPTNVPDLLLLESDCGLRAEERMLQRFNRSNALVGIQGQTPFEQVDEMIEIAECYFAKARRSSEEPCTQITGRLDHSKSLDSCL